MVDPTSIIYSILRYYVILWLFCRRPPLPPMTPSPPPTPPSSPELPVTLPKWYELMMHSLPVSNILIQCHSNESESRGRDVIWMGTYPTVSYDALSILWPHTNYYHIHRLTSNKSLCKQPSKKACLLMLRVNLLQLIIHPLMQHMFILLMRAQGKSFECRAIKALEKH